MAKLKAPRTVSKRQELRQDAVVTFSSKALEFFNRFRSYIIYGGAALILIAAGLTWYYMSQSSRNQEAATYLGRIVRLYEGGLYRQALDGTSENKGLKAIADEYGGTVSGNLAKYYTASALMEIDEKEEALKYFQSFDKSNDIVSAAAYAGEAAIYEDTEQDYAKAADLYERAGTVYPNVLTAPDYLRKAARCYEELGQFSSARRIYEAIADRYPESGVASGIDVYLTRLDMLEAAAN